MLDPLHLRTLTTVLQTGSFAVAARQLGYTPSAVSQQIAALERAVRLPVFERGARSVRPTPAAAQADGGELIVGGERVSLGEGEQAEQSFYVQPAIMRMPRQSDIVKSETFAPLMYVLSYDSFDEAIAMQNDVAQGLSSSIFTLDVREAELFMSAAGSDCGIANVNIGPSGAEIGGAFGGEKETGGGREAGSDSWKAYMRRTTNTINYSTELPLAQGVQFG